MESTATGVSHVVQWLGNISLLAALFGCLVLWSGIVLLLVSPSYPPDPVSAIDAREDMSGNESETRATFASPIVHWEGQHEQVPLHYRSPADLLLFWLPISLGALACGAGVATLAWGHMRYPAASRRALIALALSVIPGCLCALWYLAVAVPPSVFSASGR
jgi:hypothetical protein